MRVALVVVVYDHQPREHVVIASSRPLSFFFFVDLNGKPSSVRSVISPLVANERRPGHTSGQASQHACS